jgi:hypothetical protein
MKIVFYNHAWAVSACKRLADDLVHFEFDPVGEEINIFTEGYDIERLGSECSEGYDYDIL